MTADAKEAAFQQDIIDQMLAGGWQLGEPSGYNRELALYTSDCLTFVKNTQPKTWTKYETLYPTDPDKAFLDKLQSQLAKADQQATDKQLRTFGTLGVLRHELRDKSASFKLCQFKPDSDLNPDTLAMYEGNILRIVPELTYSPYATKEHLEATGTQAKKWRIDLVLFLNGIPIVTMELKSEFKQACDNAVRQYQKTRLPIDKDTKKREPLLTFKRGALVHFAVSQFEAKMCTKLEGDDTRFFEFNRGTKDGGRGNDVPEDLERYATDYLWNEVLAPDNLLRILGRFIHLEIQTEEDWEGHKHKKESLIFPRYHQWDLVTRLIDATKREGPGQKYLAQHSAGSGKSNSIAWTAHQLQALKKPDGHDVFASVIVITDRTVLDSQLQDTISQFEHKDGVVGRINRDEGQGSKSEKLAAALETSQRIIIVTLQTFPHVLKAIESSTRLADRCYAIIADEAHSSQTGATAQKLKEVLMVEEGELDAMTSEDMIAAAVASRRSSGNLSYYAFTATPKSKTLELFGRVPNPDEPPSSNNLPQPFHVYSMRQAIEERYILDVLRNYTSYKVAYNLAQKVTSPDTEVDVKKAKVRLGQWVRLHDYNIAQKVGVIIEHFRNTVMGLLNNQAKAMVVTSSRKEAVRYKLEFDKYIQKKGYGSLQAMVAFSGEVTFDERDPNSAGLVGEKPFTETGMNPGLKGRELPDAFDTSDYHVMIVAQKFQTGFDQPKLCAMYVDKKLGGIECVQTLSRLNRTFPGKKETYVLDFFNDPQDVLAAFQVYYQTAELLDVSDPNIIWDLFDKLRAAGIFLWTDVERFADVFYAPGKTQAAIGNVCRPAVECWRNRYSTANTEFTKRKELFERAKAADDPVLIANAENDMKESKTELDALQLFKSDLMAFTRYYEFMSQIVDYDSHDLEKLSIYARHLAPNLREGAQDEDPIDLSSVELSHYRLSKVRQQHLSMVKDAGDTGLPGFSDIGTGKPRDKEEEWLSQIIARMNELFITDDLTEKDQINYFNTLYDKITESPRVMDQIANNSLEQAMLGDFPAAMDNAVMEIAAAHQNQSTQYMNSKEVATGVQRLLLEMLKFGRRLGGGPGPNPQ